MKQRNKVIPNKLFQKQSVWIFALGCMLFLYVFLINSYIFSSTQAQEENMPENIDGLLQDFGLFSPATKIGESALEIQIEQTIPKIISEQNNTKEETILKNQQVIESNNEAPLDTNTKDQTENNSIVGTSLFDFFNKLSFKKENKIPDMEIPIPKNNLPITVKNTKSGTESVFILNGFIKDGDKLRGKSSIDVSESNGKIPVNVSLESIDGDIKVNIKKDTIFKTKDGKEYNGVIIAPTKDILIEKDETKYKGNIVKKIEVIKIGSKTTPLELKDTNGNNVNAIVTIPMPNQKIGDMIPVRTSEDGKTWVNLGEFEVKNGDGIKNIEVPVNHFSWIDAGSRAYGEDFKLYYSGSITIKAGHNCGGAISNCELFVEGVGSFPASHDNNYCRYDRNDTSNFTGGFVAYDSMGICDDVDWISPTYFSYDLSAPSNPILINEPGTTTGDYNTIYVNGSTDGGVGFVQYEFCISTTSSQSNCYETTSRYGAEEAIFNNIPGRSTYYYFVRARDALGNTTNRQGPTSSFQIPNPPTAPTCNPTSSSGFCSSIAVSCSATDQIKYTTDGSDPTCSSSNWIDTSFSDTTNLKVAACNSGLLSTINAYTYTEEPLPGTINFSPTTQTFCTPIDVTLTLNSFYPSHTIKFTTNGTDPNCGSNQYSTPIPFSLGVTTLKAIACNACNQAGTVGTETYTYNCDVTPPVLSFTDNVSASWVTSDTVSASRGDATTAKRILDADGTCPAAISGNYLERSSTSMNQSTQINNGDFICLLGIDSVGNAATLASAADIHIDAVAPSAPTISCTIYTDNICTPGSADSTCSITSVTRGPSTPSVQYNIGAGRVSIGSTTGFTFSPAEGTTNIQMRVSDVGGGPTPSNTYTILKDSTPPSIPVPNGGDFPTTTPTLTRAIPGGGGCDTSINNYVVIVYSDPGCSNSIIGGGPTTNSYDVPGGQLSEGNTYYYTVVAIDGVGNGSNASACTSFSIQASDTTPPTLSFTDDISASWVTSDTISADRGDAATAKRTYDADGTCPAAISGNYLNRSSTSMNQSTETYNGDFICLLGIDSVGNAATLLSASDIHIDTTAPTGGSFNINNNDPSTASSSVTLNINCGSDNGGAGAIEVAYGNNPNPNSGWSACAITKAHTLAGVCGSSKTVYMRFRDSLGNTTSSDVSDSIVFDCGDTNAPTLGNPEIIGGTFNGSCFGGGEITFRASVSDDVGINTCHYDIGAGLYGGFRDSQNPGYCTASFTPAVGSLNINFAAYDTSSNLGNGANGTFTRDITAPNTPTMNPEPLYTSGTSNIVSSDTVADNGCAGGVEYQFCKSATNSSATCSGLALSSWSSTNSTTFGSLNDGQTYHYFVKSKDSFGNESLRSTSTSSTQDNTPPTCGFLDDVEIGPIANDDIQLNIGGATTIKWKYNIDASCPTNGLTYNFTTISRAENSPVYNGTYICIYGSDDAGNYCTQYSANSINISSSVNLSFTDPISSTWEFIDSITVDRNTANTRKRTYDADGICPAALSGNYLYRDSTTMNQNDESHNDEYICLLGIDIFGGSSTLSSFPEAIKIDSTSPTVPTLSCTDFSNNTCNNYTGSITCSINNTGGPSPITVDYNTGSSWIDNGSNVSFSFTPTEGTTTVQMRITDIGGSSVSNNFIIRKDTTGPTLSFVGGSSNEGIDGIRTASSNIDTGCAGSHLTPYAYQDDGLRGSRTSSANYMIGAPGIDGLGSKTVYAKARDALGNESSSYPASRIWNNVAPTSIATTTTINECGTGTLTQDVTDPRPGEMLTSNWYANPSCTGGPNTTGNSRSIYSSGVGVFTYSYIANDDDGGVSSCTGATLIVNDIAIAANNFSTGAIGSGVKSYNWKIGSNATAGSCENITASVDTQGGKGLSSIIGDTITYIPNTNTTGSDIVSISITDGDSSIIRTITFDNIDTIAPTTSILPNGELCIGTDIPINLTCTDNDSGCSQSNYKTILAGASCDTSSLNIGTSFLIPGIDGAYSQLKVCYRSIDNAGNNENINTSSNYNIDKIGPDAPLLNSPTSGSEVGITTPTFSWSNSLDLGCGTTSGYYIGIYTDTSCTTVNEGARTTSTNYTSVTPLTNGQTYYWKVLPQDTLGNTGIRSACSPFIINTNAFTISLTKSVGNYFNTGTFIVTGTFNEDTSDFDASDITISNGIISNFIGVSQSIYTWIVAPTLPDQPTASKLITVSIAADTAHNGAGTGNVISNIVSTTYDNIAPIITINNPNTNSETSKTISGSIDYGILTMTARSTNTTCDATRTFIAYAPVTFSSEADNGMYICYRAIDDAGNITYQLSNMISGIDTTPPTITVNNPDTSTAISKTITASTNTGTLTMTAGSTNTTCNATRTFIAYTPVTFSSEADNGMYICYRAIDDAGNITYQLSNMISGISTTMPIITITNPNNNPATSKDISAVTSTGSLNMTDGSTNITCDATRTFIAYAPVTFSSEADNGMYICYRAIDSLGNTVYQLSNVITGIDRTLPTLQEITGVTPNPTNDTTPDYTFSSTEAGTITYGGGCLSSTNSANIGNNLITFNPLGAGTYNTCTIRVTDIAGNISSFLTISQFTIDTDTPFIQQITPIATPTNNTTPNYTFSSNKSGTILYGGSCLSSTTSAISGNNTILFNTLPAGTYNNCTIQVRDSIGNLSNILAINQFIIDNVAPVLSMITQVPTVGNNSTPNYTFASTETGTIDYSGNCISSTTTAYAVNNTITLNTLADGTYSNCMIRVTDNVGNSSNRLAINTFTIDTVAPNLAETTGIQIPITTNPNYIFFSSESGILSYTGSCPLSTTSALSGSNTISFNLSTTGTYNDCRIRVTDPAGNISNRLNISAFIITTLDNSPDIFTFARITDAKRGRIYRSNTVTTTGLSNGTLVSSVATGGGVLYLNNINVGTGALVKNGDILYLELRASDDYEATVSSTLTIGDRSAVFTVVTEAENNTEENYVLSDDDIIVLNEIYRLINSLNDTLKTKLKDLLEHKIDDLEGEGANPIAIIKLRYIYDLLVDDINNTNDIVYTAPNGKVYIIIQKLGIGYTSVNFMPTNREKTYKTLAEIKAYIDRNNPSGTLNYTVDDSWNAPTHTTPNGKRYAIYKTTTGKYVARGMTIPKLFTSLQELKNYLDINNPKKK